MYRTYPIEQITNAYGDIITISHNMVVRTTDNAHIPFDPANTDYQEYLKWLEEGNVPEPAEE